MVVTAKQLREIRARVDRAEISLTNLDGMVSGGLVALTGDQLRQVAGAGMDMVRSMWVVWDLIDAQAKRLEDVEMAWRDNQS